ncbi:amiloride-sensitive sodium channel subunit alpha-like [Ylistrum balloti]|uniref:amiloride-sensitive sodium channel subunit alpha-like n=1 Tax=Ylistrum balloti TaxID=509963 RepID=UPI002905C13D|nr:amiloride-sensitive sodium channel subunit alpha-like [Ylistrum balloti]
MTKKRCQCCSGRFALDVSAKDSMKVKFKQYADGCYMHGPSAIARSVNIVRMTVWILVLATGWGMTVWQLTELIKKFYTYPTSTNLILNSNGSMLFPAVTVCNVNPVRLSQLSSTSTSISNLIAAAGTTSAPRVWAWDNFDDNNSYYDSYDPGTAVGFDFALEYAILDDSTKTSSGHQLEDMLVSCSFKGKSCSPSNFSHFLHYKYGNCYTFNSGFNQSITETEKTGPIYGLTLELYLEQDEYVGSLASDAGIRLTVHNQTSMPFPEENGINLAPGFKTGIALKLTEVIRAKPPHGECKDYSDTENLLYNAWAEEGQLSVKYTYVACQKTCFQKSLIQYCGCCSLDLPCSGIAFNGVLSAYPNGVDWCLYSNSTQVECEDYVLEKYEKSELPCSSDCVPPCDETEFTSEVSMSAWPSNEYLDTAINDFRSTSTSLFTTISANSATADKRAFMDQNGVKVDVYYRYLNYEVIQTEASYEVANLLSDIGGQLGLWIGLSIVSLFEIIEIISDLVVIGFLRLCGKKKTEVKSIKDDKLEDVS